MRALPLGFGLIIAALTGLIIVGVIVVRADIAALHGTSKQNVFWSAAQVEREFNALQVAVAQHALNPETGATVVQRRFDILWSRLELFGSGDVGQRLMARDGARDAVGGLLDTLKTLDPEVQSLGNDRTAAQKIGNELAVFAPAIRRATVDVLHADQDRLTNIRNDMRTGLLMTGWAVVLSMVLAATAVIIFHRQARHSAALAKQAKEASEGRIRFFSMMSHELRTPLNGLLGSLNLLRTMPFGAERNLLLDEARGSAHRLSDVLTDALALGADDGVQITRTIFSSTDVATAQHEALAGELKRRDANLSINTHPIPTYAEGDLTRLNHAASHLLLNALQRGDAKDLALKIDIAADSIIMIISTDAETPPEAFGETLARGLVESNDGSLVRTERGWHLSMPVRLVAPKARLYLTSSAMAGLYAKLLKAQGINIADTDDDDFHIALTDPMLDEDARRTLREKHPNSRIVACGATDVEIGFDAILTSPGDLKATVSSALSQTPLAA